MMARPLTPLLVLGVLATIASAVASGTHDADLIREAVVKLRVPDSSSAFCVAIVGDIHVEDGAIYSTLGAPSEWLMRRLRRRYHAAGGYGGQDCVDPVMLLGKIEAVVARRNEFEIAVGLPQGTSGIEHVRVRKNWLGRWKASSVCCME